MVKLLLLAQMTFFWSTQPLYETEPHHVFKLLMLVLTVLSMAIIKFKITSQFLPAFQYLLSSSSLFMCGRDASLKFLMRQGKEASVQQRPHVSYRAGATMREYEERVQITWRNKPTAQSVWLFTSLESIPHLLLPNQTSVVQKLMAN